MEFLLSFLDNQSRGYFKGIMAIAELLGNLLNKFFQL